MSCSPIRGHSPRSKTQASEIDRVRRVALNLCRSRWRRAQRELHLLPRLYSRPAGRAGRPDRDLDLVDALRSLSARQREAVVLRYWGALTVEECAGAMGVSVGAANQHLHRARSALRSSSVAAAEEAMT